MKTDLLIITVNEFESVAICEEFQKATGKKPHPETIQDRSYVDLGVVNGRSVFMTVSEMGSSQPGAAHDSVRKGIKAVKPSAVILAGLAFGVDRIKQKIGDILVSKQLSLYESVRVSTGQHGLPRIMARGARPQASPLLINWLRTSLLFRKETDTPVRLGLILTGEKLIDNVKFRQELLTLEPEAIGGEMEGSGLYAACEDSKKDWIVIKSICDWADGNKNQKKEENQKLAARNTAQFIVFALGKVPLPKRTPRLRRPIVAGWPFSAQTAKDRQEKVARELGVEVTKVVNLPGNVKLTFSLIPYGEFLIGTQSLAELSKGNILLNSETELEQPAHRVRITRPFYLATTETTVAQFKFFAQSKPYITDAEQQGFSMVPCPQRWLRMGGPSVALGFPSTDRFEFVGHGWAKRFDASWQNTGLSQRDDDPVLNVSWVDAKFCCEWYSTVLGCRFRLPTEAEWEYACRAGSNRLFHWGDSLRQGHLFCHGADGALIKAINFEGDTFPGNNGVLTVAPVGRFHPNAWGLHDMLGNAAEWTSDSFTRGDNYYDYKKIVDPHCTIGERRIIRGGNWFRGPSDCRCAARISRLPNGRSCLTGFRMVMECDRPFDSDHRPQDEVPGIYA